jgi:3-hydroxyisobutyrate dehydrogenase
MAVGIAGTGRMGTAVGQRLIACGHEVVVWNRTPEKTRALVEAGASAVVAPRDLPGRCDIVLSILTDADAIEEVYRGPAGLLGGAARDRLFVEMSTVRPEVEIALEETVRGVGGSMLECPVGGTTGPAREGKLIGLAGGASEDLERARPVLSDLCRRIEHAGPVGCGSALKLAINLPLIAFWEAFGEALALCRRTGLSGERLVDLFADTSGGPNVLKARMSAVAAALDGASPAGTYDIDSMRKDLRAMLAEAEALGASIPLASLVLSRADACSAAGLGDRDGVALSIRGRDDRSGSAPGR